MSEDFVIYMCPECGKTIKHTYPSTYEPSRLCFHVIDGKEQIFFMIRVYSRKPKENP